MKIREVHVLFQGKTQGNSGEKIKNFVWTNTEEYISIHLILFHVTFLFVLHFMVKFFGKTRHLSFKFIWLFFISPLYLLVLEKNKLILYPSFSMYLFQYISGGACTQEHMPAHVQIDLGEGKVALTNRFYLPHANCVKQGIVFTGKHYTLSC